MSKCGKGSLMCKDAFKHRTSSLADSHTLWNFVVNLIYLKSPCHDGVLAQI